MVYCWFFCTRQRGSSVFLSWHLSFFCLYCWLSIYQTICKSMLMTIYYNVMLYCLKGSLNISAHLSMKIILVDLNLVRTFFGNNFFILIMVRTLENNYFLVRTKLGYLRCALIGQLTHLFDVFLFFFLWVDD